MDIEKLCTRNFDTVFSSAHVELNSGVVTAAHYTCVLNGQCDSPLRHTGAATGTLREITGSRYTDAVWQTRKTGARGETYSG